jgi:hypothetical protein
LRRIGAARKNITYASEWLLGIWEGSEEKSRGSGRVDEVRGGCFICKGEEKGRWIESIRKSTVLVN